SGYAKQRNRLATFACTSSIGPGATNMVTGAATATVNRLPVLLLPGDLSASRVAPPVLQQQESAGGPDVSANDAFRPVSRFWDRINRPDQLPGSLLEAMRVLTDPAETGAVTLALPQDVQTEAFDYPEELFSRRVWHVARPVPEPAMLARAAEVVRGARRPLLVAGGGAIYSEATDALRALVEATGIPVAETYAGKGAMPYDHPCALGAIGVTGTDGANAMARRADVVVGVGTRWADFATASHSIFTDPEVRFVNLNVAPVDAFKHAAVPRVADAREGLEALAGALVGWSVDGEWQEAAAAHNRDWDERGERVYRAGDGPPPRPGGGGGARLPAGARAPAQPGRGHRGRQRPRRAPRRGRLRRREHARRPAQAVADPRPQAVPPGVRHLLQGLRDPGRHRHPHGRPEPRGVRHGRRRRLADEPRRAGHGRGREDQDHRRPRPEPRLRLHRVAVGGVGQRPLRHPLPLPRGRRRRRRDPPGRPGRQRGQPGGQGPDPEDRRGAGRRPQGGPRGRRAGGRPRRDRPDRVRDHRRRLVGRCRGRGLHLRARAAGPGRLRGQQTRPAALPVAPNRREDCPCGPSTTGSTARSWPPRPSAPGPSTIRPPASRPPRSPTPPATTSTPPCGPPRPPTRPGATPRWSSGPGGCSSSWSCSSATGTSWPGSSPPSTARSCPTRPARSSAAWRSSRSPPAPPPCSRATSPRTSPPRSTATRSASRSGSRPGSPRSTSRSWSRCGCTRSRSPAATPSCSSRPSGTRRSRCGWPSSTRRRACPTASSTSSTATRWRSTPSPA